MKELSICQSPCYLALVSFPVLSQIKPHAPLLVCPPVNSFKFLPCDHTPPEAHQLLDFSLKSWKSLFCPHTSIAKTQHTCASFRFPFHVLCLPKKAKKQKMGFCIQSQVGIVYGWDYDGIWSSSIPQLSFLIYENIFVECFRSRPSFPGHWISPLSGKYPPPHLFLFFVCPMAQRLSVFLTHPKVNPSVTQQVYFSVLAVSVCPCVSPLTLSNSVHCDKSNTCSICHHFTHHQNHFHKHNHHRFLVPCHVLHSDTPSNTSIILC